VNRLHFRESKTVWTGRRFSKYPRTFDSDRECWSEQERFTFAPEAAEIYPRDFLLRSSDGLSENWKGVRGRDIFAAFATVVMKLLQIVQPNFAYFGRKDAQQSRIITQMARDLNLDAEIVVCPIVREPDGLAMSSRNAYLSAEERKAATVLNRALDAARHEMAAGVRDSLQLQTTLRRKLDCEPLATWTMQKSLIRKRLSRFVRVSKSSYIVSRFHRQNTAESTICTSSRKPQARTNCCFTFSAVRTVLFHSPAIPLLDFS